MRKHDRTPRAISNQSTGPPATGKLLAKALAAKISALAGIA